jgi:hypothetical protein
METNDSQVTPDFPDFPSSFPVPWTRPLGRFNEFVKSEQRRVVRLQIDSEVGRSPPVGWLAPVSTYRNHRTPYSAVHQSIVIKNKLMLLDSISRSRDSAVGIATGCGLDA